MKKSVLLFFILCGCVTHFKDTTLTEKLFEKDQLVIGTTGDYAPFSFYQGKELTGIDIELGRALAKEMQLKVKFVKTTWPTLMEDLDKEKFDLAISGVTVKEERENQAYFSKTYFRFGKLPISRCKDKKKFDSLNKINQRSTRVIVNPGGTNHQFAKSNLSKATIKVYNASLKNMTDWKT